MIAAVLITVAFATGVSLIIAAARHNPHDDPRRRRRPR